MSDNNRNKRSESNRPTRESPREIPREILELYNQDNLMGDYYLDENKIPEGYRYNWKRILCMGQEDKQYQIATKRRMWTPVPGGRHPEAGGVGEEPLLVKGLMLMECPEYIAAFYDEKAKETNTQAMTTQEHIRNGGTKEMPRVVQNFSRSIETVHKTAQPIPV